MIDCRPIFRHNGEEVGSPTAPVHARYTFSISFRLVPAESGVSVDDPTFETTIAIEAARPGEPDWLFFRDLLWRGEVNDEAYAREVLGRKLGVPVESVTFRSLELDPDYREALESEIAERLDLFNADGVSEVLTKYLGSSLEVREEVGAG